MTTRANLIVRKLFSSSTFQNVSFLSLGQILAQVFSLAVLFYVPKKLGAATYGDYQIVINYIMMFKLLTFTGLNKVNIRKIARADDSNQVNQMMAEALGMRIASAILSILVAVSLVHTTPYEDHIVSATYIFAFYLFLFAAENHLFSVFYGAQKLKYLAFINVSKSFLLSISIIAVVYYTSSISWMLLIYLAIEFLIVLLTAYLAMRHCDFKIGIRKVTREVDYKSALRFSVIDFFNLLSSRIDIFMLSLLTTPANVGIYAIASTLVRKGLIVRRSVAQSIFPKYSKEWESLTMPTLIRHMIFVTGVAFIIATLLFFAVPLLVGYVIGPEFEPAIQIARALAFYLIFHYAVIPFSAYLEVTGKEANVIWIGLVRSVFNIGLNYVFFIQFGVIGIAYSSLGIWAINLLFHYYWARRNLVTSKHSFDT